MLGVGDYLWRLLPANPILLRVVESGGKRKRDMFIRCGYLGLLIVLVIFLLVTSANSIAGMSLADLARQSGQIFRGMSYMQLGLVALGRGAHPQLGHRDGVAAAGGRLPTWPVLF